MPTLKTYKETPIDYILAEIENSQVRYQTERRARKLFNNLGFSDDSYIPWRMVWDLKAREDIHTKAFNIELPVANDDLSMLSPKQQRIYYQYISEDIDSILQFRGKKAVDSLLGNSIESPHRKNLGENLMQELLDIENSYLALALVASIEAFRDPPFEIIDVSIDQKHMTYEFAISDDITLICRDKRCINNPFDFECAVLNEATTGQNVALSLRDGYFARWITSEEECDYNDIKSAHAAAFKADIGEDIELGFTESNWTEVVRKLILYVDYYDIRYSDRGHRGLCSESELEGKYIWVKVPQKYSDQKQSTQDYIEINNELVTLSLPNESEPGWSFIQVGQIQEKNAKVYQGKNAKVYPTKLRKDLVGSVHPYIDAVSDNFGDSIKLARLPKEEPTPSQETSVQEATTVYYVDTKHADCYHSTRSCRWLQTREGTLQQIEFDKNKPEEIAHLRQCHWCMV